uniref:(northern house mosquito) hypothetical protein n=1 Tax=Culex pipiens TaxID=7175 RepID=A0A8D8GFV8_CULPI
MACGSCAPPRTDLRLVCPSCVPAVASVAKPVDARPRIREDLRHVAPVPPPFLDATICPADSHRPPGGKMSRGQEIHAPEEAETAGPYPGTRRTGERAGKVTASDDLDNPLHPPGCPTLTRDASEPVPSANPANESTTHNVAP